MPRCWHCKAETPDEHYSRVVHGHQNLTCEWSGWRLRGRWLIAPDKAGRITPDRIRAILHADALARRRAKSLPSVVLPFRRTR